MSKTEEVKVNKIDPKRLEEIRRVASNRGKYNFRKLNKEAGFSYRYANTKDGKDLYYEQLGYERCVDDNQNTITLNAGDGETQVLMRIPDEYKAVIDDVSRGRVNEAEAAINPEKAAELGIGKLEITSADVENFKKRIKGK